MELNRRSFLRGVLAVSALSVMPVKAFSLVPSLPRIWADGVHCDSDGLEAALTGKPFVCDLPARILIEDQFFILRNGKFLIDRTVVIDGFEKASIKGCSFKAMEKFDGMHIVEVKGNGYFEMHYCEWDMQPAMRFRDIVDNLAINPSWYR